MKVRVLTPAALNGTYYRTGEEIEVESDHQLDQAKENGKVESQFVIDLYFYRKSKGIDDYIVSNVRPVFEQDYTGLFKFKPGKGEGAWTKDHCPLGLRTFGLRQADIPWGTVVHLQITPVQATKQAYTFEVKEGEVQNVPIREFNQSALDRLNRIKGLKNIPTGMEEEEDECDDSDEEVDDG